MTLTQSEIALFYKLWYSLIWGINEKHKIVPSFKKPIYGEKVDQKPFISIREKLWENPHWIDEFLRDNEYGELTETECGILRDWRSHFIKDRFIIVKHLAKYSVFISTEDSEKLYGVCGISDPVKEIVGDQMPVLVEAVLLPFADKIIYDSLIAPYNVRFGSGMRSEIKASYDEAKERVGIIENVAIPPVPVKAPVKKPGAPKPNPPIVDTNGANVPKAMSARYMEVAGIVEQFCDEKLDAEYKEICLRALQKLCRKRPSPLLTGKARTWACGVVYAIGSGNFIFDKSQPIHMTASEIAGWFGLSGSTAGNKAAEITKLLNLSYMNTEFQRRSLIDGNPAIWYLNVNGILVDIRNMPREAQEAAYEKGLIPYIPADQKE